MDILRKAQTYGSLNNWLTKLPQEDLQYLSEICDRMTNDTIKDEDQDAASQLIAVAIHFSGDESVTEDELSEKMQLLSIDIAMELNVRDGRMTKIGLYSLIPEEETAKFSITEKGEEHVKNMLKK